MYPSAKHLAFPTWAPSLMMTLTLAMAVDSCLFLLNRYSEELQRGASTLGALRVMLDSAGHTILVSNVTLILCFGGWLLFPVALLRHTGIAVAVAILMVLVVNLNLVPCLLLCFESFFAGAVLPPAAVERAIRLAEPLPLAAATTPPNDAASADSPVVRSSLVAHDGTADDTTTATTATAAAGRPTCWTGCTRWVIRWRLAVIAGSVLLLLPFAAQLARLEPCPPPSSSSRASAVGARRRAARSRLLARPDVPDRDARAPAARRQRDGGGHVRGDGDRLARPRRRAGGDGQLVRLDLLGAGHRRRAAPPRADVPDVGVAPRQPQVPRVPLPPLAVRERRARRRSSTSASRSTRSARGQALAPPRARRPRDPRGQPHARRARVRVRAAHRRHGRRVEATYAAFPFTISATSTVVLLLFIGAFRSLVVAVTALVTIAFTLVFVFGSAAPSTRRASSTPSASPRSRRAAASCGWCR